ncbi:ankyrin repeat protein [Alternaria alternata]|nr:ankyrin repeat protein [Alternaria alternata]
MDQGTPGKLYACHAEKKLIAYFVDRHLFLRHDKEPDSNLGYKVRDAEDSLEEMTTSNRSCKKMYDLECERKALDHELFNADDRLLEDAYDAQEVQRLKNKIHAIEREISNLETDVDVATMRAQERRLDNFWRRYKMHEELRALSASEPSINLKRAVILYSSEICRDCEKFKERVNEFFGLGIEMEWRL